MPQNSECSEICDVRIPSVSFADSVPTPFGPSGHFPLIGGIGPLCPRGAFFTREGGVGFPAGDGEAQTACLKEKGLKRFQCHRAI